MDQKLELPCELYGVISSTGNNAKLGLFGQTSSYLRSLSWQTKFLYYQQAKDQPAINHILIELYLNHPLLLKENAQDLHRTWCSHLREFRRTNTSSVTNSLLATALLLLMDITDNQSRLEEEFMVLLQFERGLRPQIANSILAILAKADNKELALEDCFKKHSVASLLSDRARFISVMEAKLLLTPFIEHYTNNKYFAVVFKVIPKILNPQLYNFFNLIIALLKMLPTDNEFWKSPFEMVPNLLIFLRENNHHHHVKKLAEILETIQHRLEDKQFLKKYYSNLTMLIDKDHPIPRAIDIARMNATIVRQSEDWIVENKALFLQGDTDSITYLSHHLKSIQSEAHIRMFIEENLKIEAECSHPVIDNIFTLLPNITCPDFVLKTIRELYIKFRNTFYYHKKLASICSHPSLDEVRITQLFKEVHLDLIENKTRRPYANDMLPVLCSRIHSQQIIQELFDSLTSKRSLGNMSEWLNDENAIACLPSLFILLSKMQDENALANHLKLLLTFVASPAYKYKVYDIIIIVRNCLPQISSRETIEELFKVLLQLDDAALVPHISALALQISDPELVKKCILRFQNCHELVLNKHEYSQWCLDALPLLFNLPSACSIGLLNLMLASYKEDDSKPEFVESTHNVI